MDKQSRNQQIYVVDKKIGVLESSIKVQQKKFAKRIAISSVLTGLAVVTPALIALKTFITNGAVLGAFVAVSIAACALPFAINSFVKTKSINDNIKSVEQDKQKLNQEKTRILYSYYQNSSQPAQKDIKILPKAKQPNITNSQTYEPEL